MAQLDPHTEKSAPIETLVADQRLLGFLMKIGKLDRAEAEAARHTCQAQRTSAIEFLAYGEPHREHELAAAIAQGLGLPLLRLDAGSVDEWAADFVDEATANRFALIAVSADDETITLAMANPFDQEAIKYVEFATGRRVRRAVAPRGDILEALSQVYRHAKTLATVLAGVPDDASVEVIPGATPSSEAHEIDPSKLAQEAEQAPIVKMVNLILIDAIASKASDIHIEPSPNVVLVRYRIDGMLVEGHQLPKWVQNPLTARIKIMAKADITERRTPQDGHFTIRHDERLVDVRVSVLPTTDGEKFVLRLLDPNATTRKLDSLGMSPQDLAKIRQHIRKPEGMILVTGPTGSGKSSTLCAIIEEIFSPNRNIVTIENPVEFNIKGVTQVEINEKQGLTFASVLRSVLRQDPDVIMVGEIRDRETAEIAFRAAQTGHLVLSTLHTNDTVSTITRLLDLGVEPYFIAPSLIAVVAQRLVRKVCERCAVPAAEGPTLHGGQRLRAGEGCATCHGTGYVGRTGCYEVLEISKGMQRLIEAKALESQFRVLAEEEGTVSLRENALAKIESGVTTSEEVARVIQVEPRAAQCPQCLNSVQEHFVACPYCRHSLRSGCHACGRALKKDWTSCPYCGAAPTAPSPAGQSESGPEASAIVGQTKEKPRILVVDDYADVRMLVRVALESTGNGMIVEEAESGADALARIEAGKPHLVILDLMMPGMDGYEVCRRLRADLKTAFIPILMLTALADTKSKSLGFLAGTDDYLVKPFENAELRSRVGWLLQRAYRLGAKKGENGEGDPARAPAEAASH
ncbi:MAG TPA: ATPase, T2SS/T4P/T4SS family [Candidatus Binatia bacterium]|nr:ATPase, T2SS/T4P/T4SS family [Candidatus Binatia bacterium]